jgi:CarD family transcriptional regulator
LRAAGPPGRTEEETITELIEEHLEDLEVESLAEEPAPLPFVEFEVGDSVVYPHHGAGKVLRKEKKEVLGESREYLTIKILHNDMTVMVPTENAALAGLRRVIDEDTVKKVQGVLSDECSEMPKNWNRRFKHNRDKIKTGDIYELTEVVRNLAIRESQKGLSTGEKQMFTRAKRILCSELMYALGLDEDEVEEHVYGLMGVTPVSNGARKMAVAAE